MSEARWKIILVRRGHSYRRVTRKGGIHNRKWRPLMVPVGTVLIMGSLAYERAVACLGEAGPYWNPKYPTQPRILEFTPELWERTKRANPGFVSRCDLFRRVDVRHTGLGWTTEDVRVPAN